MRKVFKYDLPIDDYIEISLPKGAQILSVGEQRHSAQIWALVDPEELLEIRRFRLAGTGHPITEPVETLKHIGTFQAVNNIFVWHVFEIIK